MTLFKNKAAPEGVLLIDSIDLTPKIAAFIISSVVAVLITVGIVLKISFLKEEKLRLSYGTKLRLG